MHSTTPDVDDSMQQVEGKNKKFNRSVFIDEILDQFFMNITKRIFHIISS
jgi:hypothetical protein